MTATTPPRAPNGVRPADSTSAPYAQLSGSGWIFDGPVLVSLPDRMIATGPCPPPHDLQAHLARYGARPVIRSDEDGDALLSVIEEAGLGGRGGAFFPVALKWRTARQAARQRNLGVVVVANGSEGEPAIAKDTALMRLRPHLVLDGLHLAARVLGADRVLIWLSEADQLSAQSLQRAIAERAAAGLPEQPVTLRFGPERYVSGESNAVVRALDEGVPLPSYRLVPPAQEGINAQPTLVQNVESLARVALLARYGSEAIEAGALVSVLDAPAAASGPATIQVRELHADCTVAEALRLTEVAMLGDEIQAVLLGGFGGQWVAWSAAALWRVGDLDGRRSQTRPVSLGAGLIAPLSASGCGVRETAALLQYLADSSARQCGPCIFGTRELAKRWARLAAGSRRLALGGSGRRHQAWQRDLAELTPQIEGRGACALPDGAVSISRSATQVFSEEIRQHLNGRCTSPHTRASLPVPEIAALGQGRGQR